MANEASHGNPNLQQWDPTKLRTSFEDRRRCAAFGFVRLARVAEMSLALTQAYEIRLHPDIHLFIDDLTENLRHLQPNDLGRFVALENANSVQHIFSKTFPDEPGLTLTIPDTPPYRKGPERDWCDASGNQLRLLRAPGRDYGRAMQLRDEVDAGIKQVLNGQPVQDAGGFDAYRDGWLSAGQEILEDHLAEQARLRDAGPVLSLAPAVWSSDARIIELLDKLGRLPESQSDGMRA